MNQEELVRQIMAEVTANLGADSTVSFNKTPATSPAPASVAPAQVGSATQAPVAPAPIPHTPVANGAGAAGGGQVTATQYPLSEHIPDRIKSASGKPLSDFTYQAVLNGTLNAEDFRISPETLELQAQVAESVGRTAFARNLRRASELIKIPDARLLEIYNALRPYRSTKQELLDIADELERTYQATVNAAWVREAADVYEKRDRLRKD